MKTVDKASSKGVLQTIIRLGPHCCRKFLFNDGHGRCPMDSIDYNGIHWVSVTMSVVLTEKIVQLAALFFPSF